MDARDDPPPQQPVSPPGAAPPEAAEEAVVDGGAEAPREPRGEQDVNPEGLLGEAVDDASLAASDVASDSDNNDGESESDEGSNSSSSSDDDDDGTSSDGSSSSDDDESASDDDSDESASSVIDTDVESNWDAPGEEERFSGMGFIGQSLEEAIETLTTPIDVEPGYLDLHVVGGESPLWRRRPGEVEGDNDPLELAARAERFRRFVTLLRISGPGRMLGELDLVGFAFGREEEYRPADVERLFGKVFRTHPALKRVRLEHCTVPASCLKLLASSFSAPSSSPLTSRLREFDLSYCVIDAEGISQVAAFVGSKNCLLRGFTMHTMQNNGLDPDDCRQVCDAVSQNPHLRRLNLDVKEVRGDTLGHVAADPRHSSLRSLWINGAFTDEGYSSLTRQLRTNTRMLSVDLRVREDNGDLSSFRRVLAETLDRYNFSLRRVQVVDTRKGEWSEEDFAHKPNRRIRTVVRRLELNNYRVSPTTLWPSAYGLVSAFPTLLYRLLRRGDVDALSNVLLASSTGRKKRNLPT